MKNEQHFPRELLHAPIAERIAYFENCMIQHARLNEISDLTGQALNSHAAPKVILLAGPTGVGKTTLALALYNHIVNEHAGQIRSERDYVPVMKVNAIAPTGASFNWKDFYIRVLEQAVEPLIDRKVIIPRQLSLFPEDRPSVVRERSVADALRRSVEECMRRRRTRYLIIDEAHHILMVNNPKRLEFQFEALKSLAIETKATIVLVGTYRLLDIRDQSGQLVRRSDIIHFSRYDHRNQKDMAGFVQALKTLAGRLPLEAFPPLQRHVNEFYQRTLGCVGILKEWLCRAYARHLETGNATFDWPFIQEFALSVKALETIALEALYGEEILRDHPIENLLNLLDHERPVVQAKAEPSRKKSSVGKRSAVRDPVGAAYAVG